MLDHCVFQKRFFHGFFFSGQFPGFTFALRTIGPAVGFVLSYFCLSLYIDPTLHPVIKQSDPRWLGAWWLGWLILGLMMGLFAFLIAMFPKDLAKEKPAVSNQVIGRKIYFSNKIFDLIILLFPGWDLTTQVGPCPQRKE